MAGSKTKKKTKKKGAAAQSPLESAFAPVIAFTALTAGVVKGALAARRGGVTGAPQPPPVQGESPPDGPEVGRRRLVEAERLVVGSPGEAPIERLPGVMGTIQAATAGKRGLGWVDTALRVQQRFGEQHGNFLAGAISLATFVALFPLLLVVIAVVGFLTSSSGDLGARIIGNLGLHGSAASTMSEALATAQKSKKAASVVGLGGLLLTGLGVIAALQYAYNQVWQVGERGIKDRLFGVVWLLGAIVLFGVTGVLAGLLKVLPGFLSPVAIVFGLLTSISLVWWTAKLLPNRNVGWRPLLPGAVLGGVGLEVLKYLGGFYVPMLVSRSSQLYGSIGTIFAILAWLVLFGKLLVYSATLNVVLWERRMGTVKAVIEVPRQPDMTAETTRMGRAEDEKKAQESAVA